VCNERGCPAEEIFVIPAQRYPDGNPDGGEPATDPFVLDLVALIPTQRSARPDLPTARRVPRPDPVLVQQMAPRPGRPPIVGRLTAVVLGGVLVAVLLLALLLI
jgi:hypothetical protein